MKYSKIIYWISTILVLLMVGIGSIGDLLLIEPVKESFKQIDFPIYILPFFGLAKLAGSIGILIKSQKIIKEWAYSGIIFYFIGAIYVHLAIGDGINKIIVPLIILLCTLISYLYSKKIH